MKRINISSGSRYEPEIGFSRAVRVGNFVAVAGTAPIGPDGNNFGVGDIDAQATRCFEIIKTALEAAGATIEDVVRTRTFLVRAEDWEAVGRAHGKHFRDVRPASTMVVVSGLLDPEWLVEIEAEAIISAD